MLKISKLIILFIGLSLATTGVVAVIATSTYPSLPSMAELRDYRPKLPLQVYSADNVLIGQFGQEHRIFIKIEDTPQTLIKAILAAEDERFYRHNGVDYIGVARAVLSNLSSGRIKSGASTITMQVAKNFFLTSQRTFSRKFNEALLAYKIEKSLTKNQILELYINQIYLGQRAYGFAEAAITYFGKELNKLSIAQYALLATLPKAPSIYNPVVNYKRARERQLYVLSRMKELHFIDENQYNIAVNEKILIVKGTAHDFSDSGAFVAEMVRSMMYAKYGEQIYTKGYKVYTTVDSKMQNSAYIALRNGLLNIDKNNWLGPEKYITRELNDKNLNLEFDSLIDYGDIKAAIVINVFNNHITVRMRDGSYLQVKNNNKKLNPGAVIRLRNKDIIQMPKVEGGIVALSPKDGAIKTLVGGFDFTNNNFNHVTQAMRQPGSSFKPFIYSAALEKGFDADSLIDSSAVCFNNYCPKNDDSEKSITGEVTFRQSLAQSLNIPTVKITEKITPQFAIDYIAAFGFDKSKFQPYLTISLGANEVTPLQLAQAYSVFASGGYLTKPYLITTITNSKDQILAKTKVDGAQKLVIDPRNAFIINNILQDAVHYGTGARINKEFRRHDIAGKTGTTTDNKDAWFSGYTPNIVAVSWVGYDKPRSLGRHGYGATMALPIWLDFMKTILPKIPVVQQALPSGITVKPNSSWRGNDEYIYTNTETPEQSNDQLDELIQNTN